VFTYAEIALLLLRIVQAIMTQVSNAKQMKVGTDAEIAKISAAILVQTQSAKAIMQKVTGMTDEQVDKALKELEP
jgi:hypothetical protein